MRMFHNMNASATPARRKARLADFAAALVIFVSATTAVASTPVSAAAPLASVAIEGSSVYTPAAFFPDYRDQLGRPATRESARAIAAAISARYREDGYARPELRLDESLIANGIMQIRVHEARITRVTIEGEPGRYRQQIERIGADVVASVPLRLDTIRNAVTDLQRRSGLSVTASTRDGGAMPNERELVLRAEFSPLSVFARMNNRGTEEVGPLFVLGRLEANDPFGWGGALGLLSVTASDPGEYLSGAAYLDHPLGETGTRGQAMVYRSRSAPNERPVDLTDEYRRERLSLRITHPFNREFTLSGALEAENLLIDRDGAHIRDDRLRVLEFGLRAAWRAGDSTRFASTMEFRKGLDAFGAGLRADDLPQDPRSADFLLAQLQLTSVAQLREYWSLRFDAFAQATGDVLPDVERFKIGGERLGRGFEVAEIAGDDGLGGKVQLNRDFTAAFPAVGRPSVYGFYDIGAAWKNDQPGRESAATLGAGVALRGERLSSYVELAKPLTHPDVEGKRTTSVFAEIAWKF
jgi:hemolysin activation/secretion protein